MENRKPFQQARSSQAMATLYTKYTGIFRCGYSVGTIYLVGLVQFELDYRRLSVSEQLQLPPRLDGLHLVACEFQQLQLAIENTHRA